jgi:Ca-activated chloride channel family protein
MRGGIDFASFSFGEPVYLWLLAAPLLLLGLWVAQVARRRVDTGRYRHERVLPIREVFTPVGDLAFWIALLLAITLSVAALARPRARVALVRKSAAADIVLLQDGSASMYVKDVNPDRWQRCVRFLRTFAETLSWKGDRVALALFAQLAAPQMRLTKDPNALFFFLDHLGTHSPFRLEDNPTWDTNIEEGVYWGLKIVQEDERLFGRSKNPKGFVVISDGQAWSGDVAIAIAAARRENIPIYAVGVGTATGGMIPEARGRDGITPPSTIRGTLDRDSLIQIARAGGGDYFEMGRQDDREIAFSIITGIRRRAPSGQVDETFEELYWWFLLAAGITLCLGALLLKGRAELWWQAVAALAAMLILSSAMR